MNVRIVIVLAAGVLAGCASRAPEQVAKLPSRVDTIPTAPPSVTLDTGSAAMTLDGYKRDLALRISQVNSGSVYHGRPQALLRSVIVVKYVVDAGGNLLRSEILRSNHDSSTEATALHSLRNTAPFPKPASHLLRRGQLELAETWLFNNDGRFQLRTIAQPQMDR